MLVFNLKDPSGGEIKGKNILIIPQNENEEKMLRQDFEESWELLMGIQTQEEAAEYNNEEFLKLAYKRAEMEVKIRDHYNMPLLENSFSLEVLHKILEESVMTLKTACTTPTFVV